MMTTREDVLKTAVQMVTGSRQDDYGTPENNFVRIADLWRAYLGAKPAASINAVDVAAMLALLKIARIASGHGKRDNWVDLAGYAACGGEIQSVMNDERIAPNIDPGAVVAPNETEATRREEIEPDATDTAEWLRKALDNSVECLGSILKDSVMRAFEMEGLGK